ncbi:ATP-binding protein [Vallicoccus soli]|uniref:histidine kinase n=1 Tax=Vallicoccus soli TaxID=2339232 RepID=A0A3A3Z3Z6_9ACTN|nr:ATP-binding protein [Vallicoccus soli]RJK98142.1 GAF domain-containing protein [Vallicoccus soli]
MLTERSRDRAARADLVRASTTAMLLAVVDMETGVRGYRLARDREFLEPYERGREAFAAAARDARGRAGDPSERALVDEQVRLEQEWRRTYGDVVAALAPAQVDVDEGATRRNKALVDAFRDVNGRLDARLTATALDAEEAEEAVRRLAVALVLGALAVALAGMLVVARQARTALVAPLVALAGVVQRLAAGEGTARTGRATGPREVRAVAGAVDALAEEAERLRAEAAETERLRGVAHALGRRLRDETVPERVLEEAVALLGEALGADAALVRLLDGAALAPAAAAWPPGPPGPGDPVPAPWLAPLHEDGAALAVPDAAHPDGDAARAALAAVAGTGATALLAVPLGSGEEALGALLLVTTGGPRAWHRREVEAALLVAADVGRALVRARLYRDQQDLVERLQELDRTKTDFLSTVSHELRTPLTSISGYLELLRDGDAGPLGDEQAAMLDVLERNARRLRLLIEDLLTLSRIEARAYSSERVPVAVEDLVAHAAATVRPAAQTGGVELEPAAVPPGALVLGDAGQLERVLLNLLSNAVKFTPAGGRVALRCAVADGRVRLEVEDTGIGIPAAEQDRLFTRFFRASNATAAAVQGTGLGLTIVRSIVEQHGGALEVASEQGRGTRVVVDLPGAGGGTGGAPVALSPTVVPLAH